MKNIKKMILAMVVVSSTVAQGGILIPAAYVASIGANIYTMVKDDSNKQQQSALGVKVDEVKLANPMDSVKKSCVALAATPFAAMATGVFCGAATFVMTKNVMLSEQALNAGLTVATSVPTAAVMLGGTGYASYKAAKGLQSAHVNEQLIAEQRSATMKKIN